MGKTAPEPRKAGRLKTAAWLAVLVVLLLAATAARFGPVAAVVLLAAVLAVAILVLRYRWARYKAGGPIAARKRRKYQGAATGRELARSLSHNPGVPIGTAGRAVSGSYQDVYAAFGPPRSGKTNWMALAGLEAPGACLLTSTRADLARDTAAVRARSGPVWFLNPGGDGGFPSTLRYTPLAGCEDRRMAAESAGALIHASPRNTDGASNWIDAQTKLYLQYLLHAAALARADIFTVRRWAAVPADVSIPVTILDAAGADRWAQALDAMSARAEASVQFGEGLAGGADAALAWLDDSTLEHAACPAPGEEFDARQFIRDCGTVYLIGADSPNCSLSPYFACFATYLWNTAKRIAADPGQVVSRDLKLDPPLMIIADEPAITCPVPLDRWAAEAAGHGIVLVTGFQSDAQLPSQFGQHAGQALEDIITVKLVFGGVTGAVAEKASRWGGDQDTWVHDQAGAAKTRRHGKERAFPPERICNLPVGSVFVKHRSTRAFIARIGKVTSHPLYERAEPAAFSAPAAIPAAPQRPAITVTPEGEASWPSPTPASSAA
jgi:type IV secretion system protein VirD4